MLSKELITILLVTIVIFTILNVFWNRDLVTSSKKVSSKSRDILGVYYLPKSIFNFLVTTNVLFEIDDQGEIMSVKIISQEFKVSHNIVADVSQPIFLNYKSNPFSDEEINFTVNEKGLLENFKAISENKIDDILFSLTDFKNEVLKTETTVDRVNYLREQKEVRVVKRKYEKLFEIDSLNFINEEKSVEWKIEFISDLDISSVKEIDIGFSLSKTSESTKIQTDNFLNKKESSGLFFRPYENMIMKITSNFSNLKTNFILLNYVNPNLCYNIPIKTTPYAKRTHDLKIQNGILKEHFLKNPSSISGFWSIPVKVGKAIMSIPAQLISIKIGNNKKAEELKRLELLSEKELVETKKKLIDARGELARTKLHFDEFREDAKNEIERLDRVIENIKSNK